MRTLLFVLLLFFGLNTFAQSDKPVKLGVVGLVHDHVNWILGMESDKFQVVGIVETNPELVKRYSERYGFSKDIVFSSIEEMITKAKPEGVTTFTSILGHLEVVEKCAPKGVHVMVEKPLAFSYDDALKMKALADKYKIQVLTNYETTWYATTFHSLRAVENNELGDLRKIVVHDGHQGPQEIGVSKEFFKWLTDPKDNGAGALIDFGCYGANLMTSLMRNSRPLSVTAVTQQIKPAIYPLVDDEATIVVTYPKAQGIIQASWNWTFSRKDMEIYGTKAMIRTIDGSKLLVRKDAKEQEQITTVELLPDQFKDPFSYFSGVIKAEVDPAKNLSSLENNMIVVEILDAAIRSSKSGKTIYLNK